MGSQVKKKNSYCHHLKLWPVNFSCFFPSRTITNVEALVPTLAQETVGGAWPAQPYLEP